MRIARIVAAVFLLWPTFVVSAADDLSPNPEQAISSQTNIEEPRFEGYLFLDAEGRPLPIQTDAEIEAFLAEAEIVEQQQIPIGITNPLRLTLEADGIRACACFSDADISRRKVTEIINGRPYFSFDWHDSYRYSIAAYRLDRLLGLDRVPPVVPRQVTREPGAVSIWLANTVTETAAEIGADPAVIDVASVGATCNFSLNQQGLLAGLVAMVPGLGAKPIEAVENACASGGQ
ncbi:MAG: hypothetical protein OQK55_04795, partial [Thermoanaerobaculales bacterium]|nr:hypothetical protein [Thermoanaerobaculales bacterium]